MSFLCLLQTHRLKACQILQTHRRLEQNKIKLITFQNIVCARATTAECIYLCIFFVCCRKLYIFLRPSFTSQTKIHIQIRNSVLQFITKQSVAFLKRTSITVIINWWKYQQLPKTYKNIDLRHNHNINNSDTSQISNTLTMQFYYLHLTFIMCIKVTCMKLPLLDSNFIHIFDQNKNRLLLTPY